MYCTVLEAVVTIDLVCCTYIDSDVRATVINYNIMKLLMCSYIIIKNCLFITCFNIHLVHP